MTAGDDTHAGTSALPGANMFDFFLNGKKMDRAQ